MDPQMNKLWKYNSKYPRQINQTLLFKSTIMDFAICNSRLDLEGIILSEISQTEREKCCVISLICGIQKIQQTCEDNKKEADSPR